MLNGLINGFVVDNKDPNHLGRVKVSFFVPGKDQASTEWARVSMPFASKEAGFHFVPEIDDEVLLSFLHSDFARPVVIGSLFNEDRRPPQHDHPSLANQDEKNTLRSLRTKSGMEVVFSEDEGDSFVRVYDGKNLEVRLDRGKDEIKVHDEKGNAITIQSSESALTLTDSSGNRLHIKDGLVEISASSKITLGADGSHPVPLGDLLMQLFNSHIHNTGVGPSSPPTQPMTNDHLSDLTFTKK